MVLTTEVTQFSFLTLTLKRRVARSANHADVLSTPLPTTHPCLRDLTRLQASKIFVMFRPESLASSSVAAPMKSSRGPKPTSVDTSLSNCQRDNNVQNFLWGGQLSAEFWARPPRAGNGLARLAAGTLFYAAQQAHGLFIGRREKRPHPSKLPLHRVQTLNPFDSM